MSYELEEQTGKKQEETNVAGSQAHTWRLEFCELSSSF